MRSIAVLMAGALAVGAGSACGGGRTGGTLAVHRAINSAAQQRAQSMVLKLSDFPDGWRASAPSSEDVAGQKKFRECLGVDYSNVTLTGDAQSKDFAMGEAKSASSEAQITKSAAQAKDGLERFSRSMASAATKACLRKIIEEAPGDYKVGEIEVGELSFTPPDVDEAKAWQIVIPVEPSSGAAKGLSVSAYLDLVYLRKGVVVANVQTSDVLSPFDSGLRDDLVRAVARRMYDESQ